MTSYASIVKFEELEKSKDDKLVLIDDYRTFNEKICAIINNKNIGNNISHLLNKNQLTFLDVNGQNIYDLYYNLRDYYKNSGVLNKIQYNKFLEVILMNITFEEIAEDSDDENFNEIDD